MFAAQVGNRHPALRLAQYRHDLGFAKSALLHQNLLEHLAEKILLLKPLIRGEDYPRIGHNRVQLNHAQLLALIDGMDWKRVRSVPVKPPEIVG
ncbi:Mobile element protein (plasmid) [Sinorhizobium fredii CCBAU 83666]|nr:Mobile element protein [Sinorhizobium fredii CCBAU 83666]